MNTPTGAAKTLSGAMLAHSKASQDVSSSNRCCGSRLVASFGEIPKNIASNSKASSSKNPPTLTFILPGASGSLSYHSSASHLLGGTSMTQFRPSSKIFQKRSGFRAPPGNRHADPTMAIPSEASIATPAPAPADGAEESTWTLLSTKAVIASTVG